MPNPAAQSILSIMPGFRLINGSDLLKLLSGQANFTGLSMGSSASAAKPALFWESAQDNIVAKAGGGQALATKLFNEVNRVTNVATAGDSSQLPVSAPGLSLLVINHGLKAMQVFGAVGTTDTIDDQAAAVGVSQLPGSMVVYASAAAGKWYSNGIAEGYYGSLLVESSSDGLVALAGGGQPGATPITTMMARFATVANGGDSSILPPTTVGGGAVAALPAGAGLSITVTNAGAQSMNVFPPVGETINALGANNAFAVAATKTATFNCFTAGQWHTLLSA